MPVSSPATGEGLPSRSASAIGSGAVSGHHVLKIVGYSRTKVVPNCKSIQSRPFTVGGVTWHARYYPNGDTAEEADSISMHLVLADSVAEGVKAKVTISLLDQDRNPVPSYKTTEVLNFSDKGIGWHLKFIKRGVLEKSEYLINDSFTVRFDLTVLKDVCKEETAFVVVPPPDLHQHFGDLLSTKEGVDVTFRVGAETFSAHRLVLAARSPVFKAELFGIMKESATTDIIPIDDMEAEAFSALLTFMYTDELPVMKEQEECVMAQHLLVAADRYFLERLKLICEDKLCRHIDKDSAATILALAKQHNCRVLKEACVEFIQSSANLDAVMETAGAEYLTRSCPSDRPVFCTSSTTVAGAVCGYHVLKIAVYSSTKDVLNGQRIDSRPFRVGGRTWFVEYHPNGSTPEATGYISLFLAFDDAVSSPSPSRHRSRSACSTSTGSRCRPTAEPPKL